MSIKDPTPADEEPQSDVFDLSTRGTIDPQDEIERSFLAPYATTWILSFDASWTSAAEQTIGFNVRAETPGDSSLETKEIAKAVEKVDFFLPANHPNPEYIADDDVSLRFQVLRKVPKNTQITVTIRNGQPVGGNALPLQVRSNVTNLHPQALFSGGGL